MFFETRTERRISWLVAAIAFLVAGNATADKVYVSSGVWAYIIEVDTESGNRREIFLDDYPRILKVTDFAVDLEGMLYIETVDALQRTGIFRVDPATGQKTPVSGGVDGFAEDLLGAGPPFAPFLNSLVLSNDSLFALQAFNGPREVNLATGDRRVISQSDPQPTTETLTLEPSPFPMHEPEDMVLLREGELAIADRYDQLLHVSIATGDRAKLFPDASFAVTPRRIDLLPDGHLVYTGRDPGAAAIWKLHPKTGAETLLSGSWGGFDAGNGPAFLIAYDIAVDQKGRLWLFDAISSALFLIAPNGNRRIVSSPDVGEGPPFFAAQWNPLLGSYARQPAAKGDAWVMQ